jgi:undecaprenyl-diphosphatase
MTLLEGILLGLLQGITEFLPISSDGHLLLAKALFHHAGDGGHAFDVAIHLGTLLATITTFRRELRPLVHGVPRFLASFRSPGAFLGTWRTDPAARYLGYFALSAIPAGLAGLWFEDAIADMNDRPWVLAPAFVVAGLWLCGTWFVPAGHRRVGLRDAILLGLAQAAAILPAISRSGTTLGLGVYLRIERAALGSFVFLMSIPPVAGAVALKARHLASSEAPLGPTLAGVVASYFAGLLALKVLLPLVVRGRLAWFGVYCIALGIFCFATFGPP